MNRTLPRLTLIGVSVALALEHDGLRVTPTFVLRDDDGGRRVVPRQAGRGVFSHGDPPPWDLSGMLQSEAHDLALDLAEAGDDLDVPDDGPPLQYRPRIDRRSWAAGLRPCADEPAWLGRRLRGA